MIHDDDDDDDDYDVWIDIDLTLLFSFLKITNFIGNFTVLLFVGIVIKFFMVTFSQQEPKKKCRE